jgi:hypothetical protein
MCTCTACLVNLATLSATTTYTMHWMLPRAICPGMLLAMPHVLPESAPPLLNMQAEPLAAACWSNRLSEKLDLDKERTIRTSDDMAAEASELRRLFLA